MNKSTLYTFVFVAFIAACYFLMQPNSERIEKPTEKTNLPWDITTYSNGTSEVFGITLETTRVDELLEILGEDHELAIISDSNDHSGLEIYYSHFKTGPLQAKLVISVSAEQSELQSMQANASSSKYLDSGARMFLLNPKDLQKIQHWTVASLSLTPAANLDEDIILSRFGKPNERIRQADGSEHFLYPDKGLDIILSGETKELIQYIAPRSFLQLYEPLKTLKESPTKN